MIHRVTCDKCGSISEYDDRSIWEGNREREEVDCSGFRPSARDGSGDRCSQQRIGDTHRL